MQIAVEMVSPQEAEERGVFRWPVARRDVSRYAWHYDATEVCYIAEGRARIETEDGNVEVERGDMVTLPAGLECAWIIREPMAKHYRIQDKVS